MKKLMLMVLLSLVTASVQASFDGLDMEGRFYFPDFSNLISTDSWTVGPGVEISGFPSGDNRTDLDVSANNITMTYISSSSWTPAAQNGPVFEVLSPGAAAITGVTINPATSQPGFDISRVSWTATTITVNWQGLAFSTGQVISLDVTFSGETTAEAVPTLSELGLAILAALLLVAGVVRFRRRPTA